MFRRLAPLLLLLILVISCKRDTLPENPAECRLTKVRSLNGNGTVGDSALLTWEGGHISTVTFPTYHYTLNYANGHVVSRVFTGSSTTPVMRDSFAYAADNSLAYMERHSFGGPVTRSDSILVSFTSGHLAQISWYVRNTPNTPMVLDKVSTYTYTGNNVTREATVVYYNGQPGTPGIVDFTYDAQPNYFNRIHPDLFLAHPYWGAGKLETMFLFMSANNAVHSTSVGQNPLAYDLVYTTDAAGRVSSFSLGGTPTHNFAYTCP